MSKAYDVLNRNPTPSGGWLAEVWINGKLYRVSLEGGKRVRAAYSTREHRKYGRHWYGVVRDEAGHTVHSERVQKSTGLVSILEFAKLIPLRPAQQRTADMYALMKAPYSDVRSRRRIR